MVLKTSEWKKVSNLFAYFRFCACEEKLIEGPLQ